MDKQKLTYHWRNLQIGKRALTCMICKENLRVVDIVAYRQEKLDDIIALHKRLIAEHKETDTHILMRLGGE